MKNGNPKGQASQGINGRSRVQCIVLPGGRVVVDVKETFLKTAIDIGIASLKALLRADEETLCGPYYRHKDRMRMKGNYASRWGKANGEITMGGQRIQIKRGRMRLNGREILQPTYELFRDDDPLNERIFKQMLLGVSSRDYRESLEIKSMGRSTSKSSVSRRFTVMTKKKLAEWLNRQLKGLKIAALFIDGKTFGEHMLIVAIGVDTQGNKHVLGLWEGSTENIEVCTMLLSNLVNRGLRTDENMLVVIDGSKALFKSVRQVIGNNAVIQRCQQHKIENVKSHLSKSLHSSVESEMRRAYDAENVQTARTILQELAVRLEEKHPGAAGSLREGLDETLTVIGLNLPTALRNTFQTTNVVESTFSIVSTKTRNVKLWRSGTMALRWMVAGLVSAEKKFRRLKGYRMMPALLQALGRESKTTVDTVAEAV